MIAIIYFLDTTIKVEQDIEEFIGLNVIGTVPKYKIKDKDEEELIVQKNSKSVISEAFNKNVIIVDADMRKGRQHNIFKVKNTNGLSNCLREIKNNEDYKALENYIQETQIPKVHISTSGAVPPNPS